jgi:hypothetical protein
MPARIAMMAMTTSSSIKVNAAARKLDERREFICFKKTVLFAHNMEWEMRRIIGIQELEFNFFLSVRRFGANQRVAMGWTVFQI